VYEIAVRAQCPRRVYIALLGDPRRNHRIIWATYTERLPSMKVAL